MSDFSTPLGWGDVFSVLSGAPGAERLIGEVMGTDPSNFQATRTFGGQVNDPMAQQRQEEISRLQSIGRGQIDDQSVTGMQQALARGGKQAYGLGQASPFSSAGARGRMARGGQLAISREAPQLVQAQRLQSQQSAREMAADQLAQAQAIEQQRLEAIQDDVVDAEVRREKAIVAKQQAASSGIGGTLMTALGLFSDKDLKKNIKPGGRRTREFLDGLAAKEFEYKNGGGVRLGILAQDVNKSKEGQNMTRKVGDSLAIDIPSTTGPVLASLADLNERLAKLEGGK